MNMCMESSLLGYGTRPEVVGAAGFVGLRDYEFMSMSKIEGIWYNVFVLN